MPKSNKKKQKRVIVSKLKGAKLYWYIYKQLGKLDTKDKKTKNLTSAEKRKIVKEQLFPKFKEGLKSAKELKDASKEILEARFNDDECNPLFIPTEDLIFIPFYEIDAYIKKLPPCIDVIVNSGIYGVSEMFNTDNYNYYGNGVKDIVETLREEFGNDSPANYFNGIVKLKEGSKNNGKSENYYVEYILYIGDEPVDSDTPVEYKLSKKQEKKKDEVQEIITAKIKKLKPEGEVLKKRKAKKDTIELEAEKQSQKLQKIEPKELPKISSENLKKQLAAIRGEEPKKETNRLKSLLDRVREQNK
jgi:hypothetical protein